MTAFVDKDKCTGCGLCPDICPEVFELTGDAATVKVGVVPEKVEATCREAAESCPVEAISLKK
ncbi:MAG: ferredoxin [Kiritimatiellae bacterium]|nr:ferredoxin [Kiritimatiellia bacterium]